MSPRARLLLALKVLVSIGLLAVILTGIDVGALLDRLTPAVAMAALGALVLLQVQALGAALRWRLVLGAHGERLPFAVVWRNVLLGLFGNQAMPSTIGGDALRVWNGWRHGLRLGMAARTLVVDRVFSFLGLILLCLLALPALTARAEDPLVARGVLTLVLGGLGCLVVLLALRWVPGRWRMARLMAPAVALSASAWQVLTDGARLAPVLALMVVPHLIDITVIWLYARALGVEAAWPALALVVPAATLTAAVPVSVAGWGLREGALVLGFTVLGLPADGALAASLLYGVSAVATGLIGAAVWSLGHTDGLGALRRARGDLETARANAPGDARP